MKGWCSGSVCGGGSRISLWPQGADIWAVLWRRYTSFEKRCWARGSGTLILSLLMTHLYNNDSLEVW